jgi:hypothetical protein
MSPLIKPLEILAVSELVFTNMSLSHFLALLATLAFMLIFVYTLVIFLSDDGKGIKITEVVDTDTKPYLPGDIAGPDDMEVYRPTPPVSKIGKIRDKIKK